MTKPTILLVEENENSLSNRFLLDQTINVILLRFKQNALFSESHLEKTKNVACFILDKENSIEDEILRFNDFCIINNIKIDYFYNISEYNQEIVQKFASSLRLKNSINESQSKIVRDKAVMKDWLKSIGLKTMSYKELLSINDVKKFAEDHNSFPVIVKWRKGLSSIEVYKIDSIKQLEELNLNYSSGRFIVEEYCPYVIWCIDSLVQDGKIVGTFFTWLPYTNLSFADKKEKFAQITVNRSPEEIKFDGEAINQKIINELKLENGYIHLEAFVDSEGLPIICEFAWRTPGEHMLSNHSKAFSKDIFSLLINITVGRQVDPILFVGEKCVGDMFLPAINGVISKISSFEELKNVKGVIDGEVIYKVGDNVKSKRQYTDCSGWLQIEGKNKEEVLSRMLEVYKKFKIEAF